MNEKDLNTTGVLCPIHKRIHEVTRFDHIKLISQMNWNIEIYYILTVYNSILYNRCHAGYNVEF